MVRLPEVAKLVVPSNSRKRETDAIGLQRRLGAAEIQVDPGIAGEVAELEAVVAFIVGRAPLVADAQIQREFRGHFPIILKIEAGFDRSGWPRKD